jgi:hypothetical protein
MLDVVAYICRRLLIMVVGRWSHDCTELVEEIPRSSEEAHDMPFARRSKRGSRCIAVRTIGRLVGYELERSNQIGDIECLPVCAQHLHHILVRIQLDLHVAPKKIS